jgi:hypothetical protein
VDDSLYYPSGVVGFGQMDTLSLFENSIDCLVGSILGLDINR